MKRIFIAIKIVPTDILVKKIAELRKTFFQDKIKWVETDNLHLTLKFIGETHEKTVMEISRQLESVSRINSFYLSFCNLGIFGSKYNPRVIKLNVVNKEPLLQLESNIKKTLTNLVSFPEQANYVPHLTLARVNDLQDKKKFLKNLEENAGFLTETQLITAFFLFESVLTSKGPIYSVLNKYSLL